MDFEECDALDLFAGTGSITLELLSRGCRNVTSVELDREHFAFISSVMRKLDDGNCRLLRADALRYVSRCRERYDIIFADPPYALRELKYIPDLVMNAHLLNDGGVFVLEHGKTQDFSSHPCFVEHRAYGSVNFSFFMDSDSESAIPASDEDKNGTQE